MMQVEDVSDFLKRVEEGDEEIKKIKERNQQEIHDETEEKYKIVNHNLK